MGAKTGSKGGHRTAGPDPDSIAQLQLSVHAPSVLHTSHGTAGRCWWMRSVNQACRNGTGRRSPGPPGRRTRTLTRRAPGTASRVGSLSVLIVWIASNRLWGHLQLVIVLNYSSKPVIHLH